MELESHLLIYVHEHCLPGEPANTLSQDDDLLDSGVLDSLALVQLISYLEETYSIQIDATEISPEHFSTVSKLAQFLRTKQK